MRSKILDLNNNIQSLENYTSHLQKQIKYLETDLTPLKLSVKEIIDLSATTNSHQTNINESSTTTNENTDNDPFPSYDGISLWRIPNFKEKLSTYILNISFMNFRI